MKYNYSICIIACIMFSLHLSYAYDLYVGGLYYSVTSVPKQEVSVVSGDQSYTGFIEIPPTITVGNRVLTVKSIEENAFSHSSIQSISIPSTVSYIGNSAFNRCDSLHSIIIEAGNDTLYCGYNETAGIYEETGEGLFYRTGSISYFYMGRNMEYKQELKKPRSFNSSYIPETCTYGYSPFARKSIDTFIVGSKVTYIKDASFVECSISNLVFEKRNVDIKLGKWPKLYKKDSYTYSGYVTQDGGTVFAQIDVKSLYLNNSYLFSKLYGSSNDKFNNLRQLYVGGDSVNIYLECQRDLQGVYISDSVQYIKHLSVGSSFIGCPSLDTISLPSSLKKIGMIYIYGTNLKYFQIPSSIDSISLINIRSANSFTGINIPFSATLGSLKINQCRNLHSILIPENTKEINFKDCAELTEVKLPAYLTSISDECFYNTSICSLEIGDDVTDIGNSSFYSCTKLKRITIGKNCRNIGSSCFLNSDSLNTIVLKTTVPPCIQENSFSSSQNVRTKLIVPKGKIDVYTKTNYWKYFWNIEENEYVPSWKVTTTCSYGGSLNFDKIIVSDGDSINIIASSINGYKLTHLVINNIDVINQVNGNLYSIKGVSSDLYIIAEFEPREYILSYIVDGGLYRKDTIAYGFPVIPAAAPTKEGYTFLGWSEIPATMPAKDVEVTGSFAINTYAVVYKVDGEIYKTDSLKYGAAITPAAAPTKEGYTFSGWSEIPTTIPAKDVEVTGSFVINTYAVDLTVGEGGTATVTNSNPSYGSSDTLTVTPNTGYQLASVVVNEVDVTASLVDGSYTITNISADVKISVTFSIINGLEQIATEADAATTVDLSGRKVQNPRKGEILIQNGKKTVKK